MPRGAISSGLVGRPLGSYVARRFILSVPLLFGISLFLFLLMHAMPGGPLSTYTQHAGARAEDIARLRHQLGLDQSVPVQYVRWLGRWLGGDWGQSFKTRLPVKSEIFARLPNSLLLMSTSFLIAIIVGVTVGIVAAQKRNSAVDVVATTVAFIGVAMPVFWLGLLLLILLAVKFRVFPAGGMYTLGAPFSLADRIRHLVLPVIAVAFQLSGAYARYVRSSMLEVLGSDFVRTANAKGLHPRIVLLRHALRNALIPLVTLIGTQLPWMIGGFVITESIFSWPGMGRLFWAAAVEQDYPIIMGVAMLISIAVVIVNLVVDVLYAILDPRITYE